MDGWNSRFLLGWPIFRGYVSFREGMFSICTGDLGTLIQSALVGVRKEMDQHMEYLETEHVEHKTDPQYQRKMVRFWKRTDISLHASKAYTTGDTEQNFDQVYYQWTKVQNLPGWWVKKIWHSQEGWLLVATKAEFSLLIHEEPRHVDQRNLVEETISSEGSMESQRQNMGPTWLDKRCSFT